VPASCAGTSEGESDDIEEILAGSKNSIRLSNFSQGILPGPISRAVQSSWFDGTIAVLILVNCATLGVEAQLLVTSSSEEDLRFFLQVAEHIFTAVFTIEQLLRVAALGIREFMPNSSERLLNSAEFTLVLVTGVLLNWLLPLIQLVNDDVVLQEQNSIGMLELLRAMRLMRMIRVVQKIELFHEVWVLLRGLTDSGKTLFWTVIVIVLITYIFAVVGTVFIGKTLADMLEESSDPEARKELQTSLNYSNGVDKMMYLLIQLLTLDSWNAILRPMVKYIPWCWTFFYLYIAVAVVVLMNLVTAVMVENALVKSKSDEVEQMSSKEKEHARELAKLSNLFMLMDEDGDGHLSYEEFKSAFSNPVIINRWKLLDFHPEECKELFRLLDRGDGQIMIGDFFDGLTRMKGAAQAKDLFRIMKMIEDLAELVVLPPGKRPVPSRSCTGCTLRSGISGTSKNSKNRSLGNLACHASVTDPTAPAG